MSDVPNWIWAAPCSKDGWRWPEASKFPMQGQPVQFAFIREDLHKAALDAAEADKQRAVEAEREACAVIVEKASGHRMQITDTMKRGEWLTLDLMPIAAAIRAQGGAP